MPKYLSEALRIGWAGAKANLRPALLLWVVGLIIVFGYYGHSGFAAQLDQLGQFKEAHRPWVAIISTALFGGFFPWFLQLLLIRDSTQRAPGRQVIPLVIFWAIHGWQVDWLYRLQAQFFGDQNDFWTIVKKTAVDEFVWAPFLALPQVVLAYLFIEKKLSLSATRAALRQKSLVDRILQTLLAQWVVWIPAVSLIYLLPLPLQLPLMNLILAFWSALLLFFARQSEVHD